jgi:monoamine oxidase
MQQQVGAERILLGTRVTSISYIDKTRPTSGLRVNAVVSGGSEWYYEGDFGAVICTTPVSTLNLIDLTNCGINENYAQYSAIRELQYGPAIKVGIQFSTNWWEPLGIIGGQRSASLWTQYLKLWAQRSSSYTDLPVRTVYVIYDLG